MLLPLAPTAVLQSPELRNYAPARPLPVTSPLPAAVAGLLGWPQQAASTPGVYQLP